MDNVVRSPGSGALRSTSSYTELMRQVRDAGLLRRRHGWYLRRLLLGLVALAVLGYAVVWLGNSWLQLLLAALLGCVLSQFAFLGHDAAHRQIFASPAWNDWTSRVVAGAVVGLAHGWWRRKHNRHHAAPNQEGRDPDIASGVLAFTPEVAAGRTRGVSGWWTRQQGWLILPLLAFEGLSLHVATVRTLLTTKERHRRLELTLVVVRLAGLVAVLLLVLPPGKVAAFLGVQLAVFGLLLGGAFLPNHTGMPIVPRGVRLDFLRRQVVMSRNIRGGPVVDTVMGGLNHQIEHHLFPSMPRPNLRLVQPLVRAHCVAHGVDYTEVGLVAAYAAVIDHLGHVGLASRGDYQCPLAAELGR